MTFAARDPAPKSTKEEHIEKSNSAAARNQGDLTDLNMDFMNPETLDKICALFADCEKYAGGHAKNYSVKKIVCALLLFVCAALLCGGAGFVVLGALHPLLNWMWGLLLICSSVGLFQLVLVIAVFAKEDPCCVFTRREKKLILKNRQAIEMCRVLDIPKALYHSVYIRLLKQAVFYAREQGKPLSWTKLQKEAEGQETETIRGEREKNRAFLGRVYSDLSELR